MSTTATVKLSGVSCSGDGTKQYAVVAMFGDPIISITITCVLPEHGSEHDNKVAAIYAAKRVAEDFLRLGPEHFSFLAD